MGRGSRRISHAASAARSHPARDSSRPHPPRPPGRPRVHTDERMELMLREFTRDRDVMPTQREFSTAGLKGLYDAVNRYGGIEYWARRLGLERAARPST